MRIDIDKAATKRVSMKIKRVAKRAGDLTPVWPKVGSYIASANRKQFTSKGAYYGTPWPPLKPDYAQRKLKSGYGRRMLVLTGGMKASFTSRPMSIEKYYKQSATFGSNHWLAKFHQYGTHRNGKRAIPPRKMMVKNARTVSAVHSIVREYVLHGKVGAVGRYL